MIINDSLLQRSERTSFALRELYLEKGYTPYRMSKFEEYDLYAGNKDFLVSDNVITFTDTNGKLMALKPDVTLSIIKNSVDAPNEIKKVFYNENVYRVSKSTDSFKEIMQAGVECFGAVGEKEICEVLALAADSLAVISENSVLTVSDLGLLSGIISGLQLGIEARKALYQAISENNLHEIDRLCADCQNASGVALLKQLIGIHGSASESFPVLCKLLARTEFHKCGLETILTQLQGTNAYNIIRIDFSVIGDTNYYNGIVFKGFIQGIPNAVLSGGQYDRLMNRLRRKSHAIGFAVYTDALDAIDSAEVSKNTYETNWVNIALPKGRIGEQIYGLFERAGFECPSLLDPGRKLIFENPEKGVRYFWVKPSDVAIYVERGAADIGVAGKDILLEYEPEVYELLDLDCSKCRMAVAAPVGFADSPSRTLRVATKFANIAKTYYRNSGRDIDIIHLNGSIEIAPILGLSDVIVDIVETGTTLRENNLEVIDTVVPISARLIANKSSYKFKDKKIENITNRLREAVESAK